MDKNVVKVATDAAMQAGQRVGEGRATMAWQGTSSAGPGRQGKARFPVEARLEGSAEPCEGLGGRPAVTDDRFMGTNQERQYV